MVGEQGGRRERKGSLSRGILAGPKTLGECGKRTWIGGEGVELPSCEVQVQNGGLLRSDFLTASELYECPFRWAVLHGHTNGKNPSWLSQLTDIISLEAFVRHLKKKKINRTKHLMCAFESTRRMQYRQLLLTQTTGGRPLRCPLEKRSKCPSETTASAKAKPKSRLLHCGTRSSQKEVIFRIITG